MSLSIIVMGASGRMGTTIANLAKEQGMTLAAVLERPERLDALAHWGCLAGTDPEVVYPQVPGAVVIDFTAPEASLANARCAVKNGNPAEIARQVERAQRIRKEKWDNLKTELQTRQEPEMSKIRQVEKTPDIKQPTPKKQQEEDLELRQKPKKSRGFGMGSW